MSERVLVDMPDRDVLLRELNHRVKNNFQIIVSLINLKRRMLPPHRQDDMRFIEEHVRSISVAYQLVYATGSIIDVSLSELIADVLSGLRQLASLGEDQLRLDAGAAVASIGLDQAIALALYLAVVVPPYLDEAAATSGTVSVAASVVDDLLTLSVRGSWAGPVEMDFLRSQLVNAYIGQLHAELLGAADETQAIRFALDRPRLAPVTQ
jgi:hypothetical protein